jgi:hypothetical protein
MTHYKCKGCGELDSIVEISLVPTIQFVFPEQAENAVPFEDVDYGTQEHFPEAETVIGFGCFTESCQFWQGDYGNRAGIYESKWFRFDRALDLQQIAEVVEE